MTRPTNATALTLVTEVLRAPLAVVDRIDTERTLATDGPRLLFTLVLAAAAFGAVVGGYRDATQAVFAGLKMPVLLLVPLLVVLPALRALWALCDVDAPYRRLAIATLVGAARTAVLAAALGPVLWLAWPLLGYHDAVLAFAGTLALAGLPGLMVIGEAVPTGGSQRWLATTASMLLLGFATMQSGWMLRPFIARPTIDVTLVRPVEDDIFHSLRTTFDSVSEEARR